MSNKNQGEGNKEAAENYNEATQDFVESGGVEENEDKHKNLTSEEREKLGIAREQAKNRGKS